jgi:double-stranded uracil-DNA glycosylase
MQQIQCFAPVENERARILILGSMPGIASLNAGRYYAHPQNLFWRIMNALLGMNPDAPYELRIEALRCFGIALWDVCRSCQRKGSLDVNIDAMLPNDFDAFFLSHPKISHVFFNGAKACELYRKHVLKTVETHNIQYLRLPSTSPANASQSRLHKLESWHAIAALVR